MSEKKSNSGGKYRNYGTIVYPESAPSNWLEILENLHLPALVSPCHNQDVEDTGEKKKDHYHVMIMYDGPVFKEKAIEVIKSFGGVGCENIHSVGSQARYFCHLDSTDPRKAKYNIDDVVAFGGVDYLSLINKPTDKYAIILEMIKYCTDNNIFEYCDLFDYSAKNRSDWFRCLCDSSTFVIKEYLKSKRYKKKFSLITERSE